MRPTVHDIAKAAGVSLATVDRVLNSRPGVRSVTRARVEEAIGQLGFVRDVAAANLAKGRVYPLVFILPDGENSFMQGLKSEVEAAQRRSHLERTAIRIITVPPFDATSLQNALKSLLDDPPAGIALVAVDSLEVVNLTAALRKKGTAVATLVSDLQAEARDHFSGVDNLAAGRTAGSLLGRFCVQKHGCIGVIAGSMMVGDHRDRLSGFEERMADLAPDLRILPVQESHDNPDAVHAGVRQLIADNDDLVGIYNLGAGNRGLIRAIGEIPPSSPRPKIIVHELTPHTRQALLEDRIDAVLNQDPGHEVRSAIRVLKATVDGVSVIADQERIRIDIFLKDNLP